MRNLAESVRFSADIVRVISDYVTLKASGSSLKGLCPFHSEKTPSFSVHRERQIFHCFGCQESGDVFAFVMKLEGVGFPESIRIVAEKCGIPMPKVSPADDRAGAERVALIDMYEQAAAYFRKRLGSGEAAPARRILEERQIQPEFAERFGVGYAPSGGLGRVVQAGKDPVKTGLFLKNDRGEVYDRFRRRLMFPIANERGKVIAFGGRIIGDGQPKYLNSPESPLYSKSFVLYGMHLARQAARKAGLMVVVEGYFDVLSLHQNGVENVVASCGTSLTPQQVAVLARHVREIVINYDPDAAGQAAAKRSIELLLEQGLTVRILRLPGGLDPDDFVRKEGGEAYVGLLERAPYFWQHLIEDARRRDDLSQPEVKSQVVGEIVGYVRHITDRVVQLEILRSVAETFRLPLDVVMEGLQTGSVTRAAAKRGRPKRTPLTLAEKQIIQAVLQDSGIATALEQFADSEFLSEIRSGRVIRKLIGAPETGIENALEGLDDSELAGEVRAAAMEPFGEIRPEVAIVSMGQLYQDHLARKEKEIREELRSYGPGAAPADLVRRQMEIATEKSKLKAIRP